MSSTYHAFISQTHSCNRNPEAHLPGLDCMEDNLVIQLLLRMDADTLLAVGRANVRLYKLVCNQEVWRWLLKGIEDFTVERLRELRVFVKKAKKSEEMRQEVLREAAHRLKKEFVHHGESWGLLGTMSVSIQGWGKPYILETDCKVLISKSS